MPECLPKKFSSAAVASEVWESVPPMMPMIAPGGKDECRAYVDNITRLGKEYRDLLMG